MSNSNAALSPLGVTSQGPTVLDLPPEARRHLEQHGTARVYREGEEIQRHLVVPAHASWLQTGRVKSFVMYPDGTEQHGGWVMEGELFGVYNLLVGCPSRVTLRVDTSEARLLHFSREVLLDMMRTMPEGRLGIAMGLSRRIVQLYDIIDAGGPRTLLDKLRTVLVWWARNHGLPALDGSVELWVAQNELANGVGASRQRVHLELQTLQEQGEIDLAYRKIIIRPRFFKKMQGAFA